MKKLLASVAIVIAGALAIASPASALTGQYTLLKGLTATTDTTVTVTTAGTFYVALAQNANRKQCYIINQDGVHAMSIFFGAGTATTAKSIVLPVSSTFNCATAGVGVVTDEIQVTVATGGSGDTPGVIELQ